jgi:hypothetical protein
MEPAKSFVFQQLNAFLQKGMIGLLVSLKYRTTIQNIAYIVVPYRLQQAC